jgi:hypothetical protein
LYFLITLILAQDEKFLVEDNFMLDSLNDKQNAESFDQRSKDEGYSYMQPKEKNGVFMKSLTTAISYFEQCIVNREK